MPSENFANDPPNSSRHCEDFVSSFQVRYPIPSVMVYHGGEVDLKTHKQ